MGSASKLMRISSEIIYFDESPFGNRSCALLIPNKIYFTNPLLLSIKKAAIDYYNIQNDK